MARHKPETYRQRGNIAPQLALRVTWEDIEEGVREDAKTCAIAHAVLRVFPDAEYLRVDMNEVAFSLPSRGIRRRYFQTAPGAKATFHFDRGELDKLHPFTLRLNDGIEVPMGWRAKHPGSSRAGKTYRNTGWVAPVRFTRRRYFGACNIATEEGELALSRLGAKETRER